jgi:hypothetical protein
MGTKLIFLKKIKGQKLFTCHVKNFNVINKK